MAEFDAGRISKVSSNGARETYISGLTHPESIAFDPSGNLYVCAGAGALDAPAKYIDKIAVDKTITRFASLEGITYINYDAGSNNLLVSAAEGKIHMISQNGDSSVFVSGLESPMGIIFDQTGNLYIADDTIDTVFKFTKLP